MSQPIFPTQPSPIPEGGSVPPPASASEVPPAPPAEPMAVPPTEPVAVPPAEPVGVPPAGPIGLGPIPPAGPIGQGPVPPAGPIGQGSVPPAGPIGPETAPPPPPWSDGLASLPGSQMTAPATGFPPAFASPDQVPPAQGTDQAYAPGQPNTSGQPFAPDQPYAPSQPYAPGQPYAPQPNMPGQPYPGQPYAPDQFNTAGQPYAPGQPYVPGQPYGVGEQPPTPPKKKKTWLIILIIALAVVLVGGGIFFAVWHSTTRDDGIKGGRADDDPVEAGQATTAQAAVRGYLQALAAGNSADALSFATDPPSDTTFLTDDVLAASLAINPITFQQAVREDLSTQDYIAVTADYQIGSQSVDATYLTTLRDGYYFIDQVTAPVDLYAAYVSDIGMELNGVPLSIISYPYLFPGSYQLSIDNSMLTLTGGQFVVTDPMAYPPVDMSVELAADTPAQLASAAKTTLDGCMAEKSLMSDCGIGLPIIFSEDKIRDVDDSTVRWDFITGNSDFSPDGFYYDPLIESVEASAPIDVTVRRTVNGEGADAGYIFYSCYDISSVSVYFSDPDNLDASFISLPDATCPSPR